MEAELKAISDFYDFMLCLVQRIEVFPRHDRYSRAPAERVGPRYARHRRRAIDDIVEYNVA